jgi:hypothetical protein
MFKAFSVFLGLSAMLATTAALAAGWSTNAIKVTNIELGASAAGVSETYLQFSSAPNGAVPSVKPACATSSWVKVDGSADFVKAVTTLATTSMLSGKTVRVYWKGTCDATYTTMGLISRLELVD